MSLKKEIRVQTILSSLLISLMIITLLQFLLNFNYISNSLGMELLKINETQTQSANAVTSVVTYFRGFDTLGEVTILFLSVFGVSYALGDTKSKLNIFQDENQLLQIGVKILFPIIILFGIYIILNGHLSPGGGFQGGVIIASAFLLKFLAIGDNFTLNHKIMSLLESLSAASFLIIGVLGILIMNIFFGNFLPLGVMGDFFSAGVIPLIYIFVGLKVASEIIALIEYFVKVKDV